MSHEPASYAPAATPGDAAHLSAERLAEIRAQLDVPRARNSYVTDYGVAADVIDELLEHADALSAELAALQQQAAALKAETDSLKNLLRVSESFREAYRAAKMSLYTAAADNESMLDALMQFMPCGEGALERAAAKALGGRAKAASTLEPAAVPKQQKGGSAS